MSDDITDDDVTAALIAANEGPDEDATRRQIAAALHVFFSSYRQRPEVQQMEQDAEAFAGAIIRLRKAELEVFRLTAAMNEILTWPEGGNFTKSKTLKRYGQSYIKDFVRNVLKESK